MYLWLVLIFLVLVLGWILWMFFGKSSGEITLEELASGMMVSVGFEHRRALWDGKKYHFIEFGDNLVVDGIAFEDSKPSWLDVDVKDDTWIVRWPETWKWVIGYRVNNGLMEVAYGRLLMRIKVDGDNVAVIKWDEDLNSTREDYTLPCYIEFGDQVMCLAEFDNVILLYADDNVIRRDI